MHDDVVLHAVVVKDGKLYCSNMINKQGDPFCAKAAKLLPTKHDSCGQHRVTRNLRMAYLRSIRPMYLCEPNQNYESSDDNSNPNSRYEIVLSTSHKFTVGMINLPSLFSEDNYYETYKRIFKKAYKYKGAKSAPMAILGSTIFVTSQQHYLDGAERRERWKLLDFFSFRVGFMYTMVYVRN